MPDQSKWMSDNERDVGDGDIGGECEHGEGESGVPVRVAHVHAENVGVVHANADVVEGAGTGVAADGEHVVREGCGGRGTPA